MIKEVYFSKSPGLETESQMILYHIQDPRWGGSYPYVDSTSFAERTANE